MPLIDGLQERECGFVTGKGLPALFSEKFTFSQIWLTAVSVSRFFSLWQGDPPISWGYTYAGYREFGGLRGWLAGLEGGNSRDKGVKALVHPSPLPLRRGY